MVIAGFTISIQDIVVQSLGLLISVSLCFMGHVSLTWVRRISVLTSVAGLIQSLLLNQPAVAVMSAVNLTYYTATLFEDKHPIIRSTAYKLTAFTVALLASCVTQYIVLGDNINSPATLAILGGATGLIMAICHNFWTLKSFTLANVALWSTYYGIVGAYTSLIGNGFVLVGVFLAVWRHMRNHKTDVSDTSSSA